MKREKRCGVVERYHAGPMTPRTGFDSRPCHRMLPPGRAAP